MGDRVTDEVLVAAWQEMGRGSVNPDLQSHVFTQALGTMRAHEAAGRPVRHPGRYLNRALTLRAWDRRRDLRRADGNQADLRLYAPIPPTPLQVLLGRESLRRALALGAVTEWDALDRDLTPSSHALYMQRWRRRVRAGTVRPGRWSASHEPKEATA